MLQVFASKLIGKTVKASCVFTVGLCGLFLTPMLLRPEGSGSAGVSFPQGMVTGEPRPELSDSIVGKFGSRIVAGSELAHSHVATLLIPTMSWHDFLVVLQAAKNIDVSIDTEYLMGIRKSFMRNYGFEVGQTDEFDAFLKQKFGLNLEIFEFQLGEFALVERILRPFVFKDCEPTEEELKALAKENPIFRPRQVGLFVSGPMTKAEYEARTIGYKGGPIDGVSSRPALIKEMGLVQTTIEYDALAPDIKAMVDSPEIVLDRLSAPLSDESGLKVVAIVSLEAERPLAVSERRDDLIRTWIKGRQKLEVENFVRDQKAKIACIGSPKKV